ncbi:MAG: AAA family ATPase [Bacteroidales bacterium]|nr:AAA family ATPase [Bacteroidales bacterium]
MDPEIRQQVEDLIFLHFPHTPTDGQREACSQLVDFLYDPDPQAAFMLKGYAGTGKTSLVSALIRTTPLLKLRSILLAPTGRAAKVLSGYSGKKAYTIHKKIYTTVFDISGTPHMERAVNKHSYTLFIVDEASMIGLESEGGYSRRSLLEDLIDYVNSGSHCRIMFIGDTAQLPPVGDMESPALDPDYLLSLAPLKLYSCELTEVVRQQQVSGILHNATLLRNVINAMEDFDEVEMPLFDLKDFSDIVRLPGAELEEVLNKEYYDHALEEIAIITRSNKRANMFNQGIRNRILFREEIVNAGDYLMIVKNNYFWLENDSDIGFIANGDIVEVMGVRNSQELYGFHFVDATLRFVDYPGTPTQECKLILETLISESPALTYEEHQKLFANVMEDYMDIPNRQERMRQIKKNPYYNALQIKFSYALTCHKTQGGQWDTVIIDQGYLTDDMLNKEYLRWLYTALTRATGKVYLLNFEDKFFD